MIENSQVVNIEEISVTRDSDGRDPICAQLTEYFRDGARDFFNYLISTDRNAVPTFKSAVKYIFNNIINPRILAEDEYPYLYDTSDINVQRDTMMYQLDKIYDMFTVTLHVGSSVERCITGYVCIPSTGEPSNWRAQTLDDLDQPFTNEDADSLITDCEKYMMSLRVLDVPAGKSLSDLVFYSNQWLLPVCKL